MKRILFACLIGLGLTACTDDFESINTSPNSPIQVPTSYLFTQAQRNLTELVLGESTARIGVLGSHYIQHLSQTQYTDATRYASANTSFYPFYTGGLADLENIIQLNSDEATRELVTPSGANNNQIALAKIMQSWAFLSMTDVWGDIPYSNALQGLDNLNPVYDRQEDIYKGVVSTLVEAGDMISDGTVSGDIIFDGAMSKWEAFANSLILRAGIRVSKVDNELADEFVDLALSRGVIESNAGNAELNYIGQDDNSSNSFYLDARTRTDYAVSDVLVDFLKERNDPRLFVYADPTVESVEAGNPMYVGMIYGVTEGEAGAIPATEVSYPGIVFRSADSPLTMLTYSEVLFNRAEAVERGYTDGDAEDLYNAAIKASMNQYGIDDDNAISNYVDQDEVDYSSDNFEQLIGQQKWAALYFQGVEAWSSWRRLGYPVLEPAKDAILVTTIPTRRGYVEDEFSLNKVNYLEAIMRQFGSDQDALDGHVWWDVD